MLKHQTLSDSDKLEDQLRSRQQITLKLWCGVEYNYFSRIVEIFVPFSRITSDSFPFLSSAMLPRIAVSSSPLVRALNYSGYWCFYYIRISNNNAQVENKNSQL